ncbi:MAG TPA: hypothetical protein VFA85_03690 [Terriglobales bacterium]|nr:hypothetical protein [Terriglobales bacterium]
MTIRSLISLFVLMSIFFAQEVFAQEKSSLADNAALRYWAAFSELQDSGITADQAKELDLILDGTAPYRDDVYKDLLERNVPALKVMARGTRLQNCDWGLDYGLGSDTPVEYARKALQLGRLNVLYAFHLSLAGDKDGTAHTLAAGVRFSRDVANGSSLFGTLVASDLLVTHFHAIEGLLHLQGITAAQKSELRAAISHLRPAGLDWQAAVNREFDVLERPEWQESMRAIRQNYAAALKNPSALETLQQTIASAPPDLRNLIAKPERVLKEKQDLGAQLQLVRQALK